MCKMVEKQFSSGQNAFLRWFFLGFGGVFEMKSVFRFFRKLLVDFQPTAWQDLLQLFKGSVNWIWPIWVKRGWELVEESDETGLWVSWLVGQLHGGTESNGLLLFSVKGSQPACCCCCCCCSDKWDTHPPTSVAPHPGSTSEQLLSDENKWTCPSVVTK